MGKADRQRGQTRVTIDDEMGDLWTWYSNIPERNRAREIYNLVVVGFATMQGLARGSLVNVAGPASLPGPDGARGEAKSPEQGQGSSQPAQELQDARTALGGLGGLDFDTAGSEVAA